MSTTANPGIFDPKYAIVMSFRDLISDIDKSLSDISVVTITADASGQSITTLKNSYTNLKETISTQLKAWSTTDLTTLSASLATSKSQKDGLDTTRHTYIMNGKLDLTFSGIAHATAQATLEKFALASVFSAFIFGGIVVSNTYIEESFLIRVFYFIYGAALFPISLIYGIFYTPTWHSALFPLFEKTKANIPLFSYKKPTALDPSGGNKFPLMICCIINLLLVWISLSLLSS